MSGLAIELRGVRKHYGFRQPWVVRDVDLAVDSGSILEIAGANGAGKSTLLRILAGAVLPTAGVRHTAEGLALGYMPERLTAPAFSAGAYLHHHVRLRGLDDDEGRREIAELAERLQARHLLGERMARLSKGSLQKVAAMQSLLGRPRFLVMDEPFASLDAPSRWTLTEILRERAERGTAVVFCEHRDGSAQLADRRLVLRDGRLADETTPDPGAGAGASEETPVRFTADRDASDREIARLIDDGWHIVRVQARGPDSVEIRAVRRDESS
jgi:ABC-type multidrug transport system ATPase subunit